LTETNQILVCFFLVAAVVHLLVIRLEGGEYARLFIAVMILSYLFFIKVESSIVSLSAILNLKLILFLKTVFYTG